MANKSTLKSQIASAIPDNAAEEITASSLRGAFDAVIDDYAGDFEDLDARTPKKIYFEQETGKLKADF